MASTRCDDIFLNNYIVTGLKQKKGHSNRMRNKSMVLKKVLNFDLHLTKSNTKLVGFYETKRA